MGDRHPARTVAAKARHGRAAEDRLRTQGVAQRLDVADAVLDGQHHASRCEQAGGGARRRRGAVRVGRDEHKILTGHAGTIDAGRNIRRHIPQDPVDAQPVVVDRRHVLGPGVDEHDLVAGQRESSAEGRPDRSGTDDADPHRSSLSLVSREPYRASVKG
jgi:hypothetical protein